MKSYEFGQGYLEDLAIDKGFSSKRISSWDKTGKNNDFISLEAWEKRTIATISGAGAIKHIYATAISLDPLFYRNVLIRIFWDEEETPSVEVPLGDFFGIGHCKPRLFHSTFLSVNTGNLIDPDDSYTYGINSYFPMPFSQSALIELENQSDIPVQALWYHVDFQQYDRIGSDVLRFHARWNREITHVSEDIVKKNVQLWDGVNLDGKDNYTILDVKGRGQMVGFLLNVDNIAGGWWGEGDDMAFIDGESWPPSIHGTGTEEIFGGGACPTKEYSTPSCGFHLLSNGNWSGKNSMYRFFIVDPLRFEIAIKYSIEHGHSNNFENDYSSVAYWYQAEPHSPQEILPPEKRTPVLKTKEEREAMEIQLKTIKYYYQNKANMEEEISEDTWKILLIAINKAEHFYHSEEFSNAIEEWNRVNYIINGL